jgi:hypothetical protein
MPIRQVNDNDRFTAAAGGDGCKPISSDQRLPRNVQQYVTLVGQTGRGGRLRISEKLRRRIVWFVALSAALHVLVTALLLLVPRHQKAPVVIQLPEKIYPAMLSFAGGAKAEWTPQPPGRRKHPQDAKQQTSDLAIDRNPAPVAGRPVDAPHSDAPGNGADKQNADPAFPVFSPRPPVTDRSLLPDSNREVVVDVKVSAAGDVLEATLVKGIGN